MTVVEVKRCKKCGCIHPAEDAKCPECGHRNPRSAVITFREKPPERPERKKMDPTTKRNLFYVLICVIGFPLYVIIELCRDMTGKPKYWRGGHSRRW